MIHYGYKLHDLERAPLTAVLGEVYGARVTGTLKVMDRGGTSVSFVFWFKRGFPCFSYSRDRFALLAEQLADGKRRLAQTLLDRREGTSGKPAGLAGQLLIGEAVITFQELQEALQLQLTLRLLACASAPDVTFQFDEGMDEFGTVPLSSPLLNPLEIAARAAALTPLPRMHEHVTGQSGDSHVRLAAGRRIPPQVRAQLADSYLDSLTEPSELSAAMDVPSRLRTLGFLYAFGFVESCAPKARPPRVVEPKVHERQADPRSERTVLVSMLELVRGGATHYELLGVAPTADRREIKRKYRSLAFQIHPDRVPGEASAASREVFAHLVDGYHALSKERIRVQYDRELVLSGKCSRLGSEEQIAAWLAHRKEHLTRIGLLTLASEYERLLASPTLSMGPPLAATWENMTMGHPSPGTRV